jgi:hypothetical protein
MGELIPMIRQRRNEVLKRLQALQRAAQEDGGQVPHHELSDLIGEMRFLIRLTHWRLAQLQGAEGGQSAEERSG